MDFIFEIMTSTTIDKLLLKKYFGIIDF